MKIETISYLKKHAANLSLEEPITITQNGVPIYVIESFNERQKRDETLALLKMLSFSVNDENNGETISSDSLKERLAKRKHELETTQND